MKNYFEAKTEELYNYLNTFVNSAEIFKANYNGDKIEVKIPKDFREEFFKLIHKVTLSLMEEKDNFYGYFLFQMNREIRFDLKNATGINFKGAKYVIYFNPLIFLQLNLKQMESSIKHEIHHILALHLLRAKEVKSKYSTLAINLAMDIVVNQHLDNLPSYSTTLKSVNLKYSLELEPYNTFEYYASAIQNKLNLLDENNEGEEDDSRSNEDEEKEMDFDPEKTHDLWDEVNEIDEKTLKEFTEKFVNASEKGTIPIYLDSMIKNLKNRGSELPWNLYLKRLMGIIESNKKKTITRRNRRQPNRLDLRGELRNHKAEVAVAIDVSGSISDEEFKQAIKEVLNIVKNYNHEITIIECDNEIRRTYKAKSIKDVKERVASGGGTRFTPVIKYANSKKINLLIYFTDGKGEDHLKIRPVGYKILWVISGRGENLSLKEKYGYVKKLSKVEVKDNYIELKDVKHDGYSMNSQEPIF